MSGVPVWLPERPHPRFRGSHLAQGRAGWRGRQRVRRRDPEADRAGKSAARAGAAAGVADTRNAAAHGGAAAAPPMSVMNSRRNKHDAADAEAICEAVSRPTMRFVPVKTADQQAAVLLHRGREQLVRQRTMLVNALRAHLAEFGIVAAQGLRNVSQLIAIVRDERDARLPDLARQVLQVLAAQIEQLEAAVAAIEKQLMAWHKSSPISQRLASVP